MEFCIDCINVYIIIWTNEITATTSLCLHGCHDITHLDFVCPNYNDKRLVLLNSVSQITEPMLSYLLRGNYMYELSVNDNDKLFKHVQTFIQETTRFNWIYLCNMHLYNIKSL